MRPKACRCCGPTSSSSTTSSAVTRITTTPIASNQDASKALFSSLIFRGNLRRRFFASSRLGAIRFARDQSVECAANRAKNWTGRVGERDPVEGPHGETLHDRVREEGLVG